MIDHEKDCLISLSEAAAALPRRRGGRQVHVTTVYRWAGEGLRGVRLETVQVGGTKCTSREALARFYARLADRNQGSVSGDQSGG